ncbi:MAG TPA: DUF3336 domain-containing protein [Nevskiaceae bacterium]|nr:DUF3336 domain-containing protein [Nevskiaceae bacterium]
MARNPIVARRRDLAHAVNYATWRDIALELDELEGGAAWREDATSDDYDHLLIRERLQQLSALRVAGNARPLVFELVAGLHGNLGNMANPPLYAHCRVGTKQLIADYIEEVARCLEFICHGEFPDFTDADKAVFFKRAGHSFGRSALLLSGGATLGMFHLGVVKALWERKLLPRVLTGASAGAIIAAMVAARSDAELGEIFDPQRVDLEAFHGIGWRQAWTSGALLDATQLERCIGHNVPARTFIEAFEHTRRIFGVTVSPASPNQQVRLLNYLTAPHVLIHRAVLASCAVPGVFPPAALRALDYTGAEVAYMPSRRWIDGSIANDLPLLRLARLHNVNHYIVSQTNPHVVPFLRDSSGQSVGAAPSFTRDLAFGLGRELLAASRRHLRAEGLFGTLGLLNRINQILQQRYSGDINIYAHQTPAQLTRMFSNLSPDQLHELISAGERATWPRIERIRLQTRISRSFEDCLAWLKQRGVLDTAALQPAPAAARRQSPRLTAIR